MHQLSFQTGWAVVCHKWCTQMHPIFVCLGTCLLFFIFLKFKIKTLLNPYFVIYIFLFLIIWLNWANETYNIFCLGLGHGWLDGSFRVELRRETLIILNWVWLPIRCSILLKYVFVLMSYDVVIFLWCLWS